MIISTQKLYPLEVIRRLLVQPPEILLGSPLTLAIAAIQQQTECNCAMVIEAGQPVGILTQRNILGLLVEQPDLASLTVQDAMGRSLITYPAIAQMDVVAIQQIFTDQHISHLPIIDEQQQLLGVLTEKKLLDFLNTDAARLHLAQETVEEKARLYNRLVELAPMGIFRTDAAGAYTFVNPDWCNITGLNFNEALGAGWSRALHPDDQDRIAAEWDESVAEQRPFDLEYRFLRPDGEVVWVHGRCVAAEYDADGQVTGYVGSIINISDRKAADSILTMLLEGTAATIGEDFFAALVTHLAKATGASHVFVNELKGDRLYNLAYWEKDGLQSACNYPYKFTPCEFVLDEGFFQCLDDADLRFPKDMDLLAMKIKSYVGVALKNDQAESIGNICVFDPQPISPAKAKIINHILRIFAARASAELLRKRTDEALQRLNQTLEKRVEERTAALQKSEQKLRLITDSVPAAIAYIDTEQRYQFVNQTYATWFGKQQTEILGKTAREILGEDKYTYCLPNIQKVLNGETIDYATLELAFEDRTHYVAGVLMPDYDEQNVVQGCYFFANDISDRHRAEMALQESEAELKGMFAAMDDVVLVVSPDGSYIKVIETQSDQFYCPPEDLIGKSTADVFSGEQLAFFEDCIQRTFASGKSQQFEYSLPIRGVDTWFNATCSLISEDRLLWVARDISDRRRTEEALRASEQRYLNLMAVVPVGIVRLDLHGVVTYANQRAADICGLQTKDFYDNNWREAIHPDDRDRTVRMWQRAYADQTLIQYEHRFVQPDGSIRWVYVQTMPEKDIEGELIGTVGTITDITDRKEAELAVQEISQRLAIATQSAKIGIWEYHCIDNTLIWDEQMHVLYNTDPAHFTANLDSWVERVHPDDVAGNLAAFDVAIANNLDELAQEFRVIHTSGEVHYIKSNAIILRNEAGEVEQLIGVNWEVSAYKQVEKALIHAKETAESAAQTKSMFLANMSHEIRTPMNGVIGMLHLLQDTELTDQQRSHINIAQSSAESLLSLINDILDFSKVEAGKLAIEHIDFDPHELIGSFAKTMALKAAEKGLDLILDLRGIDHILVNGDPGRLRQILINLTSNAIKFTERGDIVLTCRLTQADAGLIFTGTLTDPGIGIPQDTLDHLFEPFTQMDASTTRKYGGTGLGLTITKKLCQLMGGDITATSEVGKGSQFRFTIELQASNEVRDLLPLPRIAPLKLLLVDDNAVQREILHSQLAAWGVEVTEAASGTEALELFDGRSPTDRFDIVLMDRTLPDMGSISVGKILWSKAGETKLSILMMTAIANKSAEIDSLDLEVAAYLTKPIMPSELLDALVNISAGVAALQFPVNSSGRGANRHESEAIAYPKRTRLLLVEDNKVNQMVIRGLLKKMGLQISTAMNGVEALWLLRESSPEEPFTCILMDCLMPEMNGYETTREIRQGNAGTHYQSIPIVALTANAMKGDREKCIAAGMDDYLSKPINPDTMRTVLNQWLLRTHQP